MDFEELLNANKIERVEKEEFDSSFAEKDIDSAKNSFDSEDYDWALSIAYNAVLRASRSLMSFLGYRPIGKEHHKNVFEFLRKTKFDETLVDYFDSIRKKRNKFIYGVIESTSKENADVVISKAEDFVHKIRTFVHKIRTQNLVEEQIKGDKKLNEVKK
ncbi:HEPN domain-containing protein [Candidatus Pacearchaeota archaeon]|nr:HEPN domain-containing protein [Candidatus Pacearchaeota archaeon]